MSYCINCGEPDTLEPVEKDVFLEVGHFLEHEGRYEHEGDVTILCCTECGHEMIDISGEFGSIVE